MEVAVGVDDAGSDLSPLLNPNTPEQAEAAVQAIRALPGFPHLSAITREQRYGARA